MLQTPIGYLTYFSGVGLFVSFGQCKNTISSRSRDQSNFLFVVCKFVQNIGSQAETLETGSSVVYVY